MSAPFAARLVSPSFSVQRIPKRYMLISSLSSILMITITLLSDSPFYITLLFASVPWLPLIFLEEIWRIERYILLSCFGLFAVLQLGFLGGYVNQIAQIGFYHGVWVCPVPVDTPDNVQRAVALGLRHPELDATGLMANSAIRPQMVIDVPSGSDATATEIIQTAPRGIPSCGIFSQRNGETLQIVWGLIASIAMVYFLIQFPSNYWLWIAVIFAGLYAIDQLYIGYAILLERGVAFLAGPFPSGPFLNGINVLNPLWATLIEDGRVIAYPAGTASTLDIALTPQNFYQLYGYHGLFSLQGLIAKYFDLSILPLRPYAHLGLNFFAAFSSLIAFIVESRRAYDKFLGWALPHLTDGQLLSVSSKLAVAAYQPGELIVEQGKESGKLFILTQGTVDVIQCFDDGDEKIISSMSSGQYFGEISLLQGTVHTASIQARTEVQVMMMDRETFMALIAESKLSRREFQEELEKRLMNSEFQAQMLSQLDLMKR
ncbi:MAG: cyclic nucleotide-binding domain-containing protein [Chloroflexota bacterium]